MPFLCGVAYFMHPAADRGRPACKGGPGAERTRPWWGSSPNGPRGRPDAIGITPAESISLVDNTIQVKGIDAIDNTPDIDIKPYFPRDWVENTVIPEWVHRL